MQSAAECKAAGNAAFGQKNYEEAIGHFTKAIELDPSDHVFFSNRSACYASLARYEEALADATKCIELNRSFTKGYSRKALALYKLGREEDAVAAIDEGLAIDPVNEQLLQDKQKMQEQGSQSMNDIMGLLGDPNMQKLLKENPQLMQQMLSNPQLFQQLISNPQFAQMFAGGKSASQPKPHFAQRNEATPDPPKTQPQNTATAFDNLKAQADQLYKERRFAEAVEKYDECIRENDKNMIVRNNKAACFVELKQYKDAHAVIDEAIERFRELDFSEKDTTHLAKLFARRGRVFALEGEIEAGIEAYESSLLEDSNQQVDRDLKDLKARKLQRDKDAYINPELADQHREKGNDLFNSGEFGKALSEYEEAARRNPKDARVFNNRASCFIKIMNYQQALAEVEKALALEPNFVKALLRKGSIHQFLKEYHKAIETYEKVLKIEPENSEAKKGINATNAQIAQSMHGESDEQRIQRAMSDPEIAAIVADPMVRIALEQMQQNPRNIAEYMRDPNLGPKITKLIQAGIIRTG